MIDGNILEVALVGLCLLLGFVLCFFGYRLFRFSLFTIAFVAGNAIAVAITALCIPDLIDTSAMIWLVYILGGVLCGFLAVTLVSTGMFIAGFCGGVVIAVLFLILVGYNGSLVSLILVTVASGMICGVMTLMYKKSALVTTTSLLGATSMTFGISFFVQESLTVPSDRYYSYSEYDARWDSINDTWWTLFAILLTLIGVGMLLQFTVTGKGIYHESTVDEETSINTQGQLRQDPSCYQDLSSPMTTRASDASERV